MSTKGLIKESEISIIKHRIIESVSTAFILLVFSTPVLAQRWEQIRKVVASDRADYDYFGKSIAISGNLAIIGANEEDEDINGLNTIVNSGSAYIFRCDSTSWTQQAKIVALDRTAYKEFGISVDISGDFAVVGASHDSFNVDGTDTLAWAGSAYIFHYDGVSWSQQQKLVASDRGAGDLFGFRVSISGNYAVVGAYKEDHDIADTDSMYDAGSVYIFHYDGTTWNQQQKIVASDRDVEDWFGCSIDISGDYVVVGAYQGDHNTSGLDSLISAGAVYVFHNDGVSWCEQQKLVASDRNGGDFFGSSLAISGDYLITGAPLEDEDVDGANTQITSGSAYIFVRNDSTWTQQQKIVASDRERNDLFGFAVDITDHYAIVSATMECHDVNGVNPMSWAGSAYIFKREGTMWAQQQKIVASDRAGGKHFGNSVSVSGDNIIIGTEMNSTDASGSNVKFIAGATYIFHYSDASGLPFAPDVEYTPVEFGLHRSYPNPFNPAVILSYSLTKDAQTTLKVYNLRGQLVETLVSAYQFAGTYNLTWQPRNLSTGVYIVRLESGNKTNLQKIVFVK